MFKKNLFKEIYKAIYGNNTDYTIQVSILDRRSNLNSYYKYGLDCLSYQDFLNKEKDYFIAEIRFSSTDFAFRLTLANKLLIKSLKPKKGSLKYLKRKNIFEAIEKTKKIVAEDFFIKKQNTEIKILNKGRYIDYL